MALAVTRSPQDHTLAGFAALCHLDPQTTELKNVVVDPEAQGTGAGTLLMDSIEEAARSQGYQSIVLWTFHHLEAAMRMYFRRGYRVEYPDQPPPQAMDNELQTVAMRLVL